MAPSCCSSADGASPRASPRDAERMLHGVWTAAALTGVPAPELAGRASRAASPEAVAEIAAFLRAHPAGAAAPLAADALPAFDAAAVAAVARAAGRAADRYL